jgi:hypothetical protein
VLALPDIDNEALTAWATVAAVLAALFGPRVIEWERSRRKTPRLSANQPNDFAVTANEQFDSGIELSNAPGRDPALDVEVFFTIWSDEYEHEEATRNLGMRATPAYLQLLTTVTRINPGFLRKVPFVRLSYNPHGDSVAVGDWVPGTARADIFVGRRYIIEIAVTGSNFDAVYFSGHATVEAVTIGDDEEGVSFRWTNGLGVGRARAGEPFFDAA